jgi:hypothetical protein
MMRLQAGTDDLTASAESQHMLNFGSEADQPG